VLRKALPFLFAVGCLVSAAASGRFTIRLIVDGAISFAFIPLFDAVALAIVARVRLADRPRTPRLLASFGDGYRPWLMWIVFAAAVMVLVPPRDVFPWVLRSALSGVIPLIMAIRADRDFFTGVMGRTYEAARIDVVWHRLLFWPACIVYFFGIAIWNDTLPGLLMSVGWR
jgi:hypothetical protein